MMQVPPSIRLRGHAVLECLTHMPSERGSVDISRQYEQPPMANKTGVSVLDTGAGIPASAQRKLHLQGCSLPGADSTQIRAPWMSTICLATLRDRLSVTWSTRCRIWKHGKRCETGRASRLGNDM